MRSLTMDDLVHRSTGTASRIERQNSIHSHSLRDEQEYEWVFRWAATHALQTHWDPTIIRTHCLLIHVLHDDRLIGTGTPSHFEVSGIEAISHEGLKTRMHGMFFHAPKDLAKCLDIQARGGLGMALVVFAFPPPLAVGDKGQWVYFCERYEMREKRDAGNLRLGGRVWEVEEGVKRFINGKPMESVKDGERSRAIFKTSTVDHAKTVLGRKQRRKRSRQSEKDEEDGTTEVQLLEEIEEVE